MQDELESVGFEAHSSLVGMIHLSNEEQRNDDHRREQPCDQVLRKWTRRSEQVGEGNANKSTTQEQEPHDRGDRTIHSDNSKPAIVVEAGQLTQGFIVVCL